MVNESGQLIRPLLTGRKHMEAVESCLSQDIARNSLGKDPYLKYKQS